MTGACSGAAGLFLLLGIVAPSPTVAAEPSLVEVVRRVDRSLVHVEVEGGVGSGFVFGDPSTVVTAAHVVEGVPPGGVVLLRAVVEGEDGFTDLGGPLAATLRYVHPDLDVAVLDVRDPPVGFLPIESADASVRLLPRGTEVLVHGFPGPMSPTLSRGLVAGHVRDFNDGTDYYLLDGATGAGSSGGPVTDADGRLVAMITAVYVEGDGSSFNWAYALPLRAFRSAIESGAAPLRTAGVDELAAAVRTTPTGVARIARAGEAMRELVDGRSTIADLARDVAGLLDAILPALEVASLDDARALGEFAASTGRRVARRGAALSLRDAGYDDEAAMEFDELLEHAAAWYGRTLAQGLAGAGDAAADRAAALALPWTVVAGPAANAAAGACGTVGVLRDASELDLRRTPRETVVRALGILAELRWSAATIDRLPAGRTAAAWTTTPAARRTFETLASAVASVEAAVAALPPACRGGGLGPDDGIEWTSAEAVRTDLAARGFELDEETATTITLAAGATSWLELRLGPGDATGLLYLLGESLDGADVDFVLYRPDGEVEDVDEAVDGYPVVVLAAEALGAAGADGGPWRLEIANVEDRPTRVRIERWSG